MIVKPTVNELLEHAENRFALVIATSKRARQIAEEQKASENAEDISPVTLAANEIVESKVIIKEKEENSVNEENIEKNEEVN